MNPIQIKDRTLLADYFHQDTFLHLYSLGDLDDFYWPDTICYGVKTREGIDKVVLIYQGKGLPVLLALSRPGVLDEKYIKGVISLLPDQIYGHLNPGLEELFSEHYSIVDYGNHYKMGLVEFSKIEEVKAGNTVPINEEDMEQVQSLYRVSYPDNAFDPRMIKTGQYVGYWKKNQLVCVGGIHVYSQTYSVAALGNITTHPDYRNLGYGRAVTGRLCLQLRDKVKAIGLNVKTDNQAALHLYQSLGFRIFSNYGEFSLKKGG